MARVKFPHDEERFVPWLGTTVHPGDTVVVPDADLASYLEAGWQPGQDKETKALVEALRKEQEALRKEQEPPAGQQQGEQGGEPDTSGGES